MEEVPPVQVSRDLQHQLLILSALHLSLQESFSSDQPGSLKFLKYFPLSVQTIHCPSMLVGCLWAPSVPQAKTSVKGVHAVAPHAQQRRRYAMEIECSQTACFAAGTFFWGEGLQNNGTIVGVRRCPLFFCQFSMIAPMTTSILGPERDHVA